jgi:hypothetical protein
MRCNTVSTNRMLGPHTPGATALLVAATVVLSSAACNGDDAGEGGACAEHADCASGQVCQNGTCVDDPGRPRRDTSNVGDGSAGDVIEDASTSDEPDGTDRDGLSDDGDAGDDVGADACQADCTDRECGPDPICGQSCGPDCAEGFTCESGHCVEDTSDPLAALSPECAAFCEALCDFLLECGKDDPTCLDRCGASPRYQQLSTAACTEGADVIGLEDCPLWLDCGGRSCAIDEMCLEVIPGFSYECAAICDQTQAAPACPGGDDCNVVTDAAGRIMSSLGMCWSLL